jgi:hypothetical protein
MGTQEGVALWIRPGSGVDAVPIVRGLTGRHKAITVEGMAAAGVRAVLLGTAPPPASERQGSESPFQHLPPYPPRSSGPPPPVPGSWSGSASSPAWPPHSLRGRSRPGPPRVWCPCRPRRDRDGAPHRGDRLPPAAGAVRGDLRRQQRCQRAVDEPGGDPAGRLGRRPSPRGFGIGHLPDPGHGAHPLRPSAGTCRGEPPRGFPVHSPGGAPPSPPTSAPPRTLDITCPQKATGS